MRILDVHFFKSIFEISLYPIKHPSTHQLLRIWPQDLRWESSLHHSKHHTVKIAMLNSALGVVLVQQQNFPGQGFKMSVLVLGELLAGGRTCLSHISFSSLHFLIPETWITLISVDEKLYWLRFLISWLLPSWTQIFASKTNVLTSFALSLLLNGCLTRK